MGGEEIQIGVVRSVAPPRREVRVTPAQAGTPGAGGWTWSRFVLRNGRSQRFKLASARMAGQDWVFRLVDGVPREQVALLEGAAVYVEGVLEVLEEPVQARGLVGFSVASAQGESLGVVEAVYESPGQDTLVISRPGGATWLLPVIPQVVTEVDLAAETVALGDYAPFLVEETG